jgi:hypothetical protein
MFGTMGAGRSQKRKGRNRRLTLGKHDPSQLLDPAYDFPHLVRSPSVVAERMHLLLVAVRTGQAERRGIASDPVHEAEEACAGRLGRNKKKSSGSSEETHLEYLLVIDSREANEFDQRFLGKLALLGWGRGSECVVGDVRAVTLERGERQGIVRLLVANEA